LQMKRFFAALFAGALAITLTLTTPAQSALAAPALPDLTGHWSEPDVRAAVAAGWANGYPDGLFRPAGSVSRAEFVKLLAAATGLAPGAETARALEAAAAGFIPAKPEEVLTDLKGHWLSTQGWLKPAVAFGLVQTAGDEDGRFEPQRPISRQEIAVMAVRALGQVYTAVNQPPGDLGFSDQARLPAWVRGYVKQSVAARVLKGYPDGSFGGTQPATRAEAVVIVQRVLMIMAEGANPAIRVFVKTKAEQAPVEVKLAVPARFIDGRVYVPARSVLRALGRGPVRWDPVRQRLISTLAFTAGTDLAEQDLQTTSLQRHLTAPARIAFGELLLPVRLGTEATPFYRTGALFWEPDTKQLTIYAIADF
jgi:hypothetical protein